MHAKRIALFGSSFDPPHRGHLAVLRDLAAKKIFDEIWLVPVWKHPFDKELTDFDKRVRMTELLLKDAESPNAVFKISSVEKDLNRERSYAFDTVSELKKWHPDCDFTLIVGSDVKNELPKWHRAEELKRIALFHFIPRKGYEDSPYPEISSSEIRAKAKRGEDVSSLTTEKIADYIKKNSLYA